MAAAPSVTDMIKPMRKPAAADERKGGVSRTMVNFWLDATLLIVFLTLVWITFVLRFVFPRGTVADGWTLWGYSYDDWCNLQFGTLALLMVGILVHVMLHWTWVCGVLTNRFARKSEKPVRWEDGTRTLVGVGLIIVIVNVLGMLLAAAALMVHAVR
jgi:hypothetical protein